MKNFCLRLRKYRLKNQRTIAFFAGRGDNYNGTSEKCYFAGLHLVFWAVYLVLEKKGHP